VTAREGITKPELNTAYTGSNTLYKNKNMTWQ
jgi:hypothetical protein